MANSKKIVDDISQILVLQYDKQKKVAWGMHRNYMLLVEGVEAGRQEYINISMCASFSGAPIQQVLLHDIRLPEKVNCAPAGYRINMQYAVSGKHDKNVEKAVDAVRALVDFVITNYGVNCDERGLTDKVDIWALQGKKVFLCEESAQSLNLSVSQASAAAAEKKENVLFGIIGGLIGSVVGIALILLLARLGIISAFCSAVMGFAVVFGYKTLGKKFSVVSMVLCAAIAIGMTYLAFRIDAAIDLYQVFENIPDYNMSFRQAMKDTKLWYEELGEMDTYNHNCIMMMLAGVAGAIGAVWVEHSSQKEQFEMYKLG